jgi:predicted  nucleic acid-binding Zn-ribbon protein
MNQRWIKQTKGTYDFDVTKADELFEFLVKEGRIKLPEGHSILRPDWIKEKRYCGFHDRNSHSINDCRVFRMRIQKAILEGHLKFDNKMKLDGHPFPQNMISFSINMVTAEEKGKVNVLTSSRARQDGTVDPARQVTLKQVHGEAPRVLKSHIEIGESSRTKPRVTTRILLNKWQRQLEKECYQKRRHEEERRRSEEEARRREMDQYTREQERAHWGCTFFRHCWNEGLKLPTLRSCPKCSDKYFAYRQETVNHRSVHERIGRVHPSDDRRQKIIEVIDHPRKRQADQRWADQEEDEDEYIWQEGQWCPPGLRKSQKRRVQRLRNHELRQAGIQKKQVWRPKDKPEGSGRLAPACMVYFLPNEFMAPTNQVV